MPALKDKLDYVLQKIERARIAYSRHHIVKLVAVSKYSQVDKIIELYNCGQRAFGENKVQDLGQKMQELSTLPLQWHFIGNLQSNKINMLLDLKPFLIQSVSSLELARAIDSRAGVRGMKQKILVQVNSAREEQKGGVSIESCLEVCDQIRQECKNLQLMGLMCMGAHTLDTDEINKSFEITKKLYDSLSDVSILSMGMSGDYEIAIANGANMLRIGSEIFKTSF